MQGGRLVSTAGEGGTGKRWAIVIVGAGHAGVQAAASLRDEGFTGEITLVSDDRSVPYQRPPLSEPFMKKDAAAPNLLLRGEALYAERRIDLMLGERVDAVERGARHVRIASGSAPGYGHLVLATGSSPAAVVSPLDPRAARTSTIRRVARPSADAAG